METKTVNCPECNSSNFYSANDDLIRCRACGANIHIQQIAENNKAPEQAPADPIIQLPEVISTSSDQPALVQAGIGERLATYLIDQLVTVVIFVFLMVAGGSDGQTPDFNFYVAVVTIPFYYTLLEGSNGKTLGKLLIGTRVVHEDGSPIGYRSAFFRTLCRMIPLEVFSIFFHNGRCWHDLITRTYVIKDR